MEDKKVSVIIICFNQEKFIKKVFKTVLRQTYKNIEVVIINDGSTDNSSEIIKSYADRYKNILFFDEKENRGTAYSRKIGIESATGEYILILDAGDTIEPNYIEKAVEIFKRNEEIGIVCSKYKNLESKKIIPNNTHNTIEVLLYTGYLYSGCMFRKLDFDKIGKKTLYLSGNKISLKKIIEKLIPQKEKYDLVFSVGEVCFCSTVLRKCNLQNVSYPFDWNGATEYYNKCVILANHFERFFEKEDLVYMPEYMSEESYAYRNKYNSVIFNHDFYKELSFDNAYKLAKEKYDKRAKRLLNRIENADSVLAVFMETPTANHLDIPDSEIIKGHKLLQKTFGNKFNTLYIKNSVTENLKTELVNGLTKIVFDYRNLDDKTGLYPDQTKLKKILKNYRANLPLSYRFKRRVIKILLNFIPNKETRAKIRKIFHIY